MTKFNFSKLALVCITMLTVLYSCTKDGKLSPNDSNENSAAVSTKGSPKSTSSFGDYEIGVGVSADGKVWTYTITPKKGAKNLSHFIIDLNNCGLESATFANIVSATVNGAPADLTPTEGAGTGCNPQATTSNFIKINTSAASSWVIVITFDRGYEIVEDANAWVKAGTSCNTGTIKAPGCPKEDYCSFSQGFFFANGVDNNGASASWVNGLTIGGVLYSQADGIKFWDIDKGQGASQVINSFFQLGAVRLSGVEAAVAAQALIIDTYFTGLDVNSTIKQGVNQGGKTYDYFDLPGENNGIAIADVIAAGSAIGAYIDANHCP